MVRSTLVRQFLNLGECARVFDFPINPVQRARFQLESHERVALISAAQRVRLLVREPEPEIPGHEGLCYQAAHAATLLTSGATESPLLPLAETTAILAICDEITRQLTAG